MDDMKMQLFFPTVHPATSLLTSVLFQCVSSVSAGTSRIKCSVSSGCAFELPAFFSVMVIIFATATTVYVL